MSGMFALNDFLSRHMNVCMSKFFFQKISVFWLLCNFLCLCFIASGAKLRNASLSVLAEVRSYLLNQFSLVGLVLSTKVYISNGIIPNLP